MEEPVNENLTHTRIHGLVVSQEVGRNFVHHLNVTHVMVDVVSIVGRNQTVPAAKSKAAMLFPLRPMKLEFILFSFLISIDYFIEAAGRNVRLALGKSTWWLHLGVCQSRLDVQNKLLLCFVLVHGGTIMLKLIHSAVLFGLEISEEILKIEIVKIFEI